MNLFLNELSVTTCPTKEEGRQSIEKLVNLFINLSFFFKGFKELKTVETILLKQIAPGYSINDWLTDNAVNLEFRRIVKTKFLKFPFIKQPFEYSEEEKKEDSDKPEPLFEFKYKEETVYGLGAAYLFDSIALSFANSIEWDTSSVEIQVTEYGEEDDVHEFVKRVNHASSLKHVEQLSPWMIERLKRSIPDGKRLWLKRREIFPHLVFCNNVEKQLTGLSGNEPEFHQVVNRLYDFENYCRVWESGPFDYKSIPSKITPESDSRLSELRDKFEIQTPEGETRIFSWHARYTPGAGRIYFDWDEAKRIIYIGYIGLKIV